MNPRALDHFLKIKRPRGAWVALIVAACGGTFAGTPNPPPATGPASKLALSTWAPAGFLKNPTALSFDRAGRAYVAQTQRREGGEMTSRDHPDGRMLPDHTFTSVEDRDRFGGKGDAGWGEQTGGRKETISLLEDTRGAGKADKAAVYFEGFDRNDADVLAGVLWHEGGVYATVAPDLWLLRDSAHAGRPDDVRSLSHGYAVHMGYPGHNMHGLTVGPDGKIYYSMGDKGVNLTTPDGSKLAYPHTGTVLRCNPDGSDLEVFAYGVRNVFEIAFDKFGNLFSVDNDGDFPGERERFVYITQGSDTGWRFNWQFRSKRFDLGREPAERKDRYNPWLAEKLWVPYYAGQAAYLTPALSNYSDGPGGFKYASEGCLDERHRGYFFLAQFPKAVITSFTTKPRGAYFVMADEHTVVKGVQCVGLTLGPDGALYGAEWGKSGFKLGNTGAVVKLDDAESARSALRQQTALLLRQGPYRRPAEELVQLLAHADMRVRLDAQFELVRRKLGASLVGVAFAADQPQMARIHALWGLGQLATSSQFKAIDPPTAAELARRLAAVMKSDPDAEIRAQAVKLLGEIVRAWGPLAGEEGAVSLLGDPSPRVRFFAAAALAAYKDPKNVAPLLRLVSQTKPVDPYLRHAAVLGLVGSGDGQALAAAESHPSQQVRLAAVVALRRLASPAVARFLADRDEQVVTEAARAIHDDASIPSALPALAKVTDRPGLTGEALIRRALNANLRLGGPDQVAALVRYAAGERNPPAMRVEAVEMLAAWEDPLPNDRVEGVYRAWPRRGADEVRAALAAGLPALLSSTDPAVARAAAQLVDQLKVATDDTVFARWVADPARPAASRVTALRLLAARKDPKLEDTINAALRSDEPALRAQAVRALAATDPAKALPHIEAALSGNSVPEQQSAFALLATLPDPRAEAMLADAVDRLLGGKLPAELQLDVLEAAGARKSKDLSAKLALYQGRLSKADPLAAYLPALAGGDPGRGRDVFTGASESACVRCHSLDAGGSTVGPNLGGIGSDPGKPRRYLLESLIDPNAVVVPGYGVESIRLKDGSDLSGFVKDETADAIRVIDLEGQATTVQKADVASRTPPVSMMPAMGAVLSKSEIRDVIEYLATLKKQ